MGKISFKVFDKKNDIDANELAARLDRVHVKDGIHKAKTDSNGMGEFDKYDIGVNDVYRIVFETGNYWKAHNHKGMTTLQEIAVQINISDTEANYQISLFIEPEDYSGSVSLLSS